MDRPCHPRSPGTAHSEHAGNTPGGWQGCGLSPAPSQPSTCPGKQCSPCTGHHALVSSRRLSFFLLLFEHVVESPGRKVNPAFPACGTNMGSLLVPARTHLKQHLLPLPPRDRVALGRKLLETNCMARKRKVLPLQSCWNGDPAATDVELLPDKTAQDLRRRATAGRPRHLLSHHLSRPCVISPGPHRPPGSIEASCPPLGRAPSTPPSVSHVLPLNSPPVLLP